MKKQAKKVAAKKPVAKKSIGRVKAAPVNPSKKTARKEKNDDLPIGKPSKLGPLSDAISEVAASKRGKQTPIRSAKCVKCGSDFKTTNPDAAECQKCADKAAKKAAIAAPAAKRDEDAPRIECHLIVGDLSVAVDATDLAHVVGSGRWGNGLGLVDSWPDAVWVGLLAYLKLPADPLDRTVAESPVKRLVQRLWYEAIKGGVPEERKTVFDARDAAHIEEYKEAFESVKNGSEGHKERAKTSFGKSGETVYTPTALLKAKDLKVGGQAAMLLAAFKAVKFGPLTTAQATEGMVTAGLVTTTKPERIAGFYVCQWAKKDWLTRTVKEA